MIAARLSLAGLALTVLARGCLPLREGSEAQLADRQEGIQTGIPMGMTQAAQTQEAEGTPEPSIFGIFPSVGELAEGMTSFGTTPQAPLDLGPALFNVTTIGSGGWSKNRLYALPGAQDAVGAQGSIYLGPVTGSYSTDWIIEVTHGVELGVHETAVMGGYYFVQPSTWMERTDLVGRAAGGEGADTTTCTPHIDWQHADPDTPQLHAHGFSDAVADRPHLVMVIACNVAVRVVEVNEEARMAFVQLPPLWIDASLTTRPLEQTPTPLQ